MHICIYASSIHHHDHNNHSDHNVSSRLLTAFLSLSLSLYTYIYIYTHVYIYIYICKVAEGLLAGERWPGCFDGVLVDAPCTCQVLIIVLLLL